MSASARPKRKTANTDPTKILREYTQKRRTHTQITLDDARAATATAEKAEKNRSEHEKKVQEVSKFEDKLSREDKISQKHTARPDLYSAPGKPKKAVNAAEANKPIMELDPVDPDASPSNSDFGGCAQDGISIPEESGFDTRSSDGSAGLGFDNSDVDVEENKGVKNPMADIGPQLPVDNNYAQDAQLDSDLSDFLPVYAAAPAKAGRKVAKAKRGALRSEIHQAREEAPKAGVAPPKTAVHASGSSQKRKQSELVDADSAVSAHPEQKRPKTSEPTGLLSNWKKLIPGDAVEKQRISGTPRLEKDNDADELVHGELDEDEPDETVLAARSTKGSAAAITIRRAGNNQVRITKAGGELGAEAGDSGNRRTRKVKYTVSSLPFPGGALGATYFRKYRKTFKPTLIAWASTLDDPFGTNSLLEPTVRELWALIFPTFNYIDPNDEKWKPIDYIASEALTSWRSDLGKDALKIVKRFLLANVSKDDIPSFVEHISEDKQAFRNEFISPILAAHFKRTAGAIKDYGHPAGALGLCVASIERALEIWKHGEPPEPGEPGPDEKNKTMNGFTEAAWGFKARAWITTAKKLNDGKWASIIADAHAVLKAGGAKITLEVIEVDDEDEEHDPRAQVDV